MKNLKLFMPRSKIINSPWSPDLRILALAIIFFFSSCAASLAPKFSQGILDNLSSSSTDIFQLFAEVSAGVPSSSFTSREAKYNNLIGKLEALDMQIKARPMPSNKVINKIINSVNESLSKRGIATSITAGTIAPSATALENILSNITTMKTQDHNAGLTQLQAAAFRGNIILFLDQALTYEGFLNK